MSWARRRRGGVRGSGCVGAGEVGQGIPEGGHRPGQQGARQPPTPPRRKSKPLPWPAGHVTTRPLLQSHLIATLGPLCHSAPATLGVCAHTCWALPCLLLPLESPPPPRSLPTTERSAWLVPLCLYPRAWFSLLSQRAISGTRRFACFASVSPTGQSSPPQPLPHPGRLVPGPWLVRRKDVLTESSRVPLWPLYTHPKRIAPYCKRDETVVTNRPRTCCSFLTLLC